MSPSYCLKFSNETLVNASCPLNFDIPKRFVYRDPAGFTQCRNIMEGVDLVRSEYLQTSEFVTDFDIETSCGYNVEWISEACMNSLDDSFTCGLCTRKLLIVKEVFLDGIDDDAAQNISACSGYPNMYTAAFVNHFGPADRATAQCLFSTASKQERLRPSRSHYRSVFAGATVSSVVGILGAFSAILFLMMRRCRKNVEAKNDSDTDETRLIFGFRLCSRSTSLKRFKIKEIQNATKKNSGENIIGMGRYGNVYIGILLDGSEVAIKRLKSCSVVGDANFVHEVEVIAQVLYDHLFGSGKKKLSWPIRLKIALGTARGLAYLHHGVHPAIIHRDIKASNILLDETFEPKVADFGLAKTKSEGMTHLSTTVAGTLGYVAPEYALYGKLTEKSDISSFGAVLLEILSGRALDVVEQDMPEIGLPEVMEQYVLVAVLCPHSILYIRPTMNQIVKILKTVMVKCDGKCIRIIVNDTAEDIMSETLYGDSVRLQQVVADFLLSSVNFTPQGSQLLLVANLTKDQLGQSVHLAHLELRITHAGSGVPEALLNQMFGSDEDASEDGISLLISRKLVKLMNGDIQYLREAGRSTFIMTVELVAAKVKGNFRSLAMHFAKACGFYLLHELHLLTAAKQTDLYENNSSGRVLFPVQEYDLIRSLIGPKAIEFRTAAGEETPEVVPLGIVSPVDGSATVGQDVLPVEHVDSFPMDLPDTSEDLTVGTLKQRVDQFVDTTFSHDCGQDRLSDNVVPSVSAGPEGVLDMVTVDGTLLGCPRVIEPEEQSRTEVVLSIPVLFLLWIEVLFMVIPL
ncbi:putative Sugar transporter [Hibiscus syriacus]|uniref:non-specific serine/threonine protein kinase n=1 Tax=Hibiscus syriacus TaxID=106335 RepID=A0A6A2WL82_HIBSY|nr:putative Sugar transporter [Hibiscus syriacus]